MTWIFFSFLAVMVLLAIYSSTRRSIEKLANNWPSAMGKVINWKIKVSGGGEGSPTYKLTLRVRIETDGRGWISTIHTGEDFSSEESADEFARQLTVGPLLVYYDPTNPSRGSLNRDPLSIAPREF